MLSRKVVAICRYEPRDQSAVRFLALVAEGERLSGSGDQARSRQRGRGGPRVSMHALSPRRAGGAPGHVWHRAAVCGRRAAAARARLGARPRSRRRRRHRAHRPPPAEPAHRPLDDVAARELLPWWEEGILRYAGPSFPPPPFQNPTLARFEDCLEALALGLEAAWSPATDDETLPPPLEEGHAVAEALAFRDACGLAEGGGSDAPAAPRAAGAGAKRKAAAAADGDAGEAEDAGIDWAAEVRGDTVDRRGITVAMLKAYATRAGLKASGARRPDLLELVKAHVLANSEGGGGGGAAAAAAPVKKGRK